MVQLWSCASFFSQIGNTGNFSNLENCHLVHWQCLCFLKIRIQQRSWPVLKFSGSHLYFFSLLVSPLSLCSPCRAPLPPYIIVVLQMAIFSCDTDINCSTGQRKRKREGHSETHLPFFLVTLFNETSRKGVQWETAFKLRQCRWHCSLPGMLK